WLNLVVTTVAQTMFVDGYESEHGYEPTGPITGPWRAWLANGMPSRQIAIHRAALGYGYSYGQALPGGDAFGDPMPVLRGLSPRKTFAVYANPAEDEWPMFYLNFAQAGRDKYQITLTDEGTVWVFDSNADGSVVDYVEQRTHGVGVPPLVRY